jgi:hypothetical protein
MRSWLARVAGRTTDAIDVALFVACVSAGAAMLLAGSIAIAAPIVTAIVALAWTARFVSRRRVGLAVSHAAATAIVLPLVWADRVHFAVFQKHIDRERLVVAWEAIRSGEIRPNVKAIAFAIGAAVALGVVLALLVKALSFVPRSARASRIASSSAPFAFGIIAIVAVAREVVASSRVDAPTRRATNSLHDEQVFAEFRKRADALLASPIAVQRRPDILILHVESLRADMLRDDVMPNLAALSRRCVRAEHHYTTGTNTGTGMFGILNGLSAIYYPHARKAQWQPLPLRVLKKLGYVESSFFVQKMATYDGLDSLFFKGVVDYTQVGADIPVGDNDAKMVESYLARLASREPSAPRFDYLVFDASHYDYGYPDAFARFAPAMTLDLGFRDGIAAREGINEELKWRGPYVRNRFQNSLFYIDSLIDKVVRSLETSGGMKSTIVVVTGDHGEEFWEHGAFGHNGGLEDEQTRVAFVMCMPEPTALRYAYTSHADLFPTLFDWMGVALGDARVMTGKSLLRYDASADLAILGNSITGDGYDPKFATAADGVKVFWKNAEGFPVLGVWNERDEPMPTYAADAARAIVQRTVAAGRLEQPPTAP